MSCKNNSKIFSVFLCVVFSSVASSDNFSISNDGKVGENVALNSNLDKNLSNPVTIGDLTFGANEVLSEGNEIFEAKDGDPLRHLNIRISGLDGVGVKSVKVMSASLIDIEIGKVLAHDLDNVREMNNRKPKGISAADVPFGLYYKVVPLVLSLEF